MISDFLETQTPLESMENAMTTMACVVIIIIMKSVGQYTYIVEVLTGLDQS